MSLLLLFQNPNTNTVKVWNGSQWLSRSAKTWNGTQWVAATSVKVWNGSSWTTSKP